MDLNSLQKADLLRQLNRMNERVGKLESILQGQQIDGTKISNLTWDKAQGGTAVLGGLNNVDGELEVRDASNNEAVILNKDGIQINNGKLTIKNDSDQTSIDAKGVVSDPNFVNGAQTVAAGFNQVITADVTAPTMLTGSNINLNLSRAVNLVFHAQVITYMDQGGSGNYTANGIVAIDYNDGSGSGDHELSRIVETGGVIGSSYVGNGGEILVSSAMHYVGRFGPGNIIFWLKTWRDILSGTPIFLCYKYKFSIVLLGT